MKYKMLLQRKKKNNNNNEFDTLDGTLLLNFSSSNISVFPLINHTTITPGFESNIVAYIIYIL